jgi:hypothetical protein
LYTHVRNLEQCRQQDVASLFPVEWCVTERMGREIVYIVRPIVARHMTTLLPSDSPPLTALTHAVGFDTSMGVVSNTGVAIEFLPWLPRIVEVTFQYLSAWLATIERQDEWAVDKGDLTCRFSASQELLLLLQKTIAQCRASGYFVTHERNQLLLVTAARVLCQYVALVDQQVVDLDSSTLAFRRTFWAAACNTCVYLEQQFGELSSALFIEAATDKGEEEEQSNSVEEACGRVIFASLAALARTVCDGPVSEAALASLDAHLRRSGSDMNAGKDTSVYAIWVLKQLTKAHEPLATMPLYVRVLVLTAQRFFDAWSAALWSTRAKVLPGAARQMLIDLDLIAGFWLQAASNKLLGKVVASLTAPWMRIFKVLSVEDSQIVGLFQALQGDAPQLALLHRILDLRGLLSSQQERLVAAYNATAPKEQRLLGSAQIATAAALPSTPPIAGTRLARWMHDAQQLVKR